MNKEEAETLYNKLIDFYIQRINEFAKQNNYSIRSLGRVYFQKSNGYVHYFIRERRLSHLRKIWMKLEEDKKDK